MKLTMLSKNTLSNVWRDTAFGLRRTIKIHKVWMQALIALAAVCVAQQTMAADWGTPGVSTVDGLQDAEDPGEMINLVGKWALKVVTWIAALIAGIVTLMKIVGAFAKTHRDEDAKFGVIIKDVIGYVVGFLLVLALVVWLNSAFT